MAFLFDAWRNLSAPASTGAPPQQPAPNQGKRSDIPGGVTPDGTQATPVNWAFPPEGPAGVGGVLKYFNAPPPAAATNLPLTDPDAPAFLSRAHAPEDGDAGAVPERRLASWVVNLSAPASSTSDAPPIAPAAGASSRPLGIVSGKPMPDYPVWPSIFQTEDKSSSRDDNELWQRWRAYIRD